MGGDSAAFDGQVRYCAGAPLGPGRSCVVDVDSNPNSCNHCQYGVGGNEAAFDGQRRSCAGAPTQSPDSCAYEFNDHCYGSANDYMDAREKDWRCKPAFYRYGLCDGPPVERTE